MGEETTRAGGADEAGSPEHENGRRGAARACGEPEGGDANAKQATRGGDAGGTCSSRRLGVGVKWRGWPSG